MKKVFIKILSITTLVGTFALQADSAVTPTFVPRSQSRDKTRQVVGSVGHTHLYDMESWYGTGSIMLEYTQSFRPSRIARCLFGDDLTTGTTSVTCDPCDPCKSSKSCDSSCNAIKIQGSRVSSRQSNAWLADYFYLPSDFSGSIAFSPKIQNVNVDFDLYVGLDEWVNGLYFRIYGPITWTRWNLNFCETVDTAGTNSHPEGYFAPSCISNAALLKSFTSYVSGNTVATCDGIVFQSLKFAKMRNCAKSRVGFADLRAELGWDFLSGEDYHFGLNIQGAAPTGTKRHAEFVFDPVVGNGHHWELGGGATGHYTFWRSEDEEKSFGFHTDINLTHVFKAKEERTFDLKGKPNSRYMLAAKFTKTISNNLMGRDDNSIATAGTNPTSQFANEYAPVANLTTLNVKTSVGIQADIVAWFNLSVRGFSWDIGYNFWGRSCEKIDCPSNCDPSGCATPSICDINQYWGLKGDARMFGFVAAAGSSGLLINQAVALSATQSKASIHAGTNVPGALDTVSNDFYERNFSVDNAKFGIAGAAANFARLVFAPFLPTPNVDATQVKTSINPVLFTCDDVDLCERTRGISHKIFTHLNYTWDRESWLPYLGIGAFAEFGQGHGSCDTTCTTNDTNSGCLSCALSQWGIWVKGGLSFN